MEQKLRGKKLLIQKLVSPLDDILSFEEFMRNI